MIRSSNVRCLTVVLLILFLIATRTFAMEHPNDQPHTHLDHWNVSQLTPEQRNMIDYAYHCPCGTTLRTYQLSDLKHNVASHYMTRGHNRPANELEVTISVPPYYIMAYAPCPIKGCNFTVTSAAEKYPTAVSRMLAQHLRKDHRRDVKDLRHHLSQHGRLILKKR